VRIIVYLYIYFTAGNQETAKEAQSLPLIRGRHFTTGVTLPAGVQRLTRASELPIFTPTPYRTADGGVSRSKGAVVQ